MDLNFVSNVMCEHFDINNWFFKKLFRKYMDLNFKMTVDVDVCGRKNYVSLNNLFYFDNNFK